MSEQMKVDAIADQTATKIAEMAGTFWIQQMGFFWATLVGRQKLMFDHVIRQLRADGYTQSASELVQLVEGMSLKTPAPHLSDAAASLGIVELQPAETLTAPKDEPADIQPHSLGNGQLPATGNGKKSRKRTRKQPIPATS